MPYYLDNEYYTPQDQQYGLDYGGYENYPAPPRNTGLGLATAAAGKVNPALGIGLKFASSAANWLGGARGRGIRDEGITGLRRMLGKPVFNPSTASGFARNATYNDAQQLGNQYEKNYGLDVGRWSGELGKNIVNTLASRASGLYVDSEKAKADRDARIYQLLASYQG